RGVALGPALLRRLPDELLRLSLRVLDDLRRRRLRLHPQLRREATDVAQVQHDGFLDQRGGVLLLDQGHARRTRQSRGAS
ncbi:MAG: hypothetical protein HC828_16910, partial [Blastochloris sp.]|nr:hypothetical protein [Blastochloris sp.]